MAEMQLCVEVSPEEALADVAGEVCLGSHDAHSGICRSLHTNLQLCQLNQLGCLQQKQPVSIG